MNPSKKIYLIRHTTPQIERGYVYGKTDLPLADTFAAELEVIKKLLPQPFTLPVWSSPLIRCRTLAEHIAPEGIVIEPRLQEMNFGDWEMKRWEQIDPAALEQWMTHVDTMPTPNGESNAELRARSLDFWEELLAQDLPESAIVSHYGVIQSILSHLLEIPPRRIFRLDLGYGAVIEVRIQDKEYYKVKFLRT